MSYECRYHAFDDLSEAARAELKTLVRSLDCNPDDIAPTFAVTDDRVGVRLHLTEYQRDETGFRIRDIAAERVWTRPRVFDVDPGQLPAAVRPPTHTQQGDAR